MTKIQKEKIKVKNNLDEIRIYQEILVKTVDDNEYIIGWFIKDNNFFERPFLEFEQILEKKEKSDSFLKLKNIFRQIILIRPSQLVEIVEGEIITGTKKEVLDYLQNKYSEKDIEKFA